MTSDSHRPEGQDGVLSSLNTTIDALNLAEVSSITPVKAVFVSASVLLTEIRVGFFQSKVVNCWLMYTGLDD